MGTDDLELARRAASGERDAFQQLLERHYDLLYRLAYRFFGNSADAEDVAQEICLALAGRIGAFGGRSRDF
jgi:RNA polymerase sigma-70 factor (ECF subfamily)